MIVVCQQHKHGGPGMFYCRIEGTSKDLENGDFYDAAKRVAAENDWEQPMVAVDPSDIPELFRDFPKDFVTGEVTDEDREL